MKIDISWQGIEGVFDIEQYCEDNDIDVEEVTKLSCYNNQLTELKGLDKLVNLEDLDCHSNQLTELKGLDKLVNLEWLNCRSNQLTELKGLDKLVNLEELYCENNQLTELKGLDKLFNLGWLNGEQYQPISGQIKQIIDRLDLIIDKLHRYIK